jgi:hypothetical protein
MGSPKRCQRVTSLPAGVEDEKPSPIGDNPCRSQVMKCIDHVPGTGNAAQPTIIFSASIEPNDRGGEHLAMVRDSAIIGPPSFHVGRNDRVGAEVVAGGPDRAMMWSRAVIAKKRLQLIAPNDVAELIVERPSLFYRRVDRVQFQDL